MTEIRYTSEEKRLLENNPKITLVTPCTVVLSVEFHKEIYDGWKVARTEQAIQDILIRNGISAGLLGERYIAAIQWDLREQGNPYSFHVKSEERVKNIALVASGKFQPRRRSISWLPEFKEELCNNYPVQSFEDGIRRAGLTPELVGNQRLGNLKHSCKVKMERRQRALEGKPAKEELSEGRLCGDEGDQDEYVYYGHPYVKDVSGHKSITMSDTFYNEACVMKGMPVEELLEIYGIDAGLLSATCQSRIRCQLSVWERTDEVQGLENEQILRIQAARLCAMIRYTEEGFRTIREAAGKLSPLQKKELCRQISGYPTAPDHPGGYSLRQILLKVGISKTTYYRALYDSSYGRSEERRRELDKRELETVMEVVRYKGYEKGIRQIYMLMPSLTGQTFAISKIRRLLRQAGIRTRVRGENPARKRAVRFHERNTKPNLVKREFRLHRPNEVRLTDVTYLDYGKEGDKKRAYGSSCIDPVTGKLLVFHVSENNDLELAMETLERLSAYPAVEGAMFHSDQGILYLSDEFQEKVAEMGMRQSMSKRGNCWDNAPQESFFGHFKDECRYEECLTFGEVKKAIEEYAYYYNYERHQWTRGRMTPVCYEEYLNSLTEEEFAEYMRTERDKYDKMKENAEKQAVLRAKTLGV